MPAGIPSQAAVMVHNVVVLSFNINLTLRRTKDAVPIISTFDGEILLKCDCEESEYRCRPMNRN